MPAYLLDVYGTMRAQAIITDAFTLSDGGAAGYVLTSDASGDASWQPAPGGLSLPYSGTASHSSAAFKMTNSYDSGSTGHAVHGVITGASSTAAAGYFYANGTNGFGVKAFSNGDDCIYARQTGATAYALNVTTDTGPAAARLHNSLDGATAAEVSFTGVSGSGIDVSTTGNSASGVRVTTSGTYAPGIYVDAQGSDASGIYITSQGVGITAKGSDAGAAIYGDLDIYEYGTTNKVLELGKGLDYAEGFDVTGGRDGASPGCVLIIDADAPGKLTLSSQPYDRGVAGIVAGAKSLGSGVRLGGDGFDHDVALAGRVYCNVIATDASIEPGDMLTTSHIPGYAMKATDPSRSFGAILGKAMEPLAKGQKGQILVLVGLQ